LTAVKGGPGPSSCLILPINCEFVPIK
jgi:hypothetical protein